MRRKIFVILCFLMLSLSANSQASEEKYIVRFKDGDFPDFEEYNLEVVDKEKGIYTTETTHWTEEVSEFIDYICPDSEAFLIEGEESVMLFSLSDTEEMYYKQWEMINASEGWLLESYGNDIIVGVIDSGCYPQEDMEGNLLPGKNYLDNNSDTSDDKGHGTHVSGIIAAKFGNGGIVGVAPKAKIVPLKCFSVSRYPTVSVLAKAIYDAVDVYECDIINMSWGLLKDNDALKDAINYADSKGVILIAAVGNSNSSTIYYPAGYENVIGVGSVTAEKERSELSQYNTSVTVVAPGEMVKSTYNNGGFAYMSGTSQAAPMISGIAAVALSVDKKLTSAKLRKLIEETSQDLGKKGYDEDFGYGLADEKAIINKLMENVDCYVSPVNVSGEYAYVKIKNNTEKPIVAESIFSCFNLNKFTGLRKGTVTINPGADVTAYTDNDAEKIMHFLWSNAEDLKPVAMERK